ncbi:MAG: PIG-L deacetylase family protein [Candidatus Kariarchaeaceae archaeon]|jgi:LmbE family N-acetylglucosaminyl deacetylase
MTEEEQKTVLSLFAHPDDELGAIGTLANHAQRGDRVVMAWTTYGELTTLLPDLNIDEVKKERRRHAEEVAKIVGAEKVVILDLGDSMVQNTRDQRIEVGRLYVQERPDAVITWGMHNAHPDHRYTGELAVDGIKMARINRILGTDKPHRKNVKLLSYYEEGTGFPTKYIELSDESMEAAKNAAQFYADIYKWKDVQSWVVDRRRARGLESNCTYAEKFNVRFEFDKPPSYVV